MERKKPKKNDSPFAKHEKHLHELPKAMKKAKTKDCK